MRKLLLPLLVAFAFVAGMPMVSWGQSTTKFNDGYLTVFKVTSGSALASTGTAIVAEEYIPTTTGQTSANFSSSLPTASGNKLVCSGTATAAGQISRSENGRYLIFPGYNGLVGDANTTFTTNGALRTVNGSGTVGAGIAASSTLWLSGSNNVRGGTSDDGTNFWVTGNGIGIQYIASATSVVTVSSTSTNNRAAFIFNGQLYLTTGAGSQGIYQVGTGKPTTTGQTGSRLFTPANTDTYGFSISPDGTTIYFVGAATGTGAAGIYRATNNGTTWTTGTQIAAITGYTGLAVDWTNYTFSTSAANGAKVYASNTTTIVSLSDNGTSTATTTSIATCSGNNAFRGLSFSPVKQTLALGANTPAAANITKGTSSNVLFQFKITADEGNSTVKKVILTNTGSASLSTDITSIKLVVDANSNGVADASEISASTTKSATISGSTITFSGLSLGTYLTETSSYNFLVIGDVASGASTGNTFIPKISKSTTLNSQDYTTNIVNASGSYVYCPTGGITGNTLTIAGPSITPSTSSVTVTSFVAGSGPVNGTSFTISGSNLTGAPGNITITGSTNFEVSTTSASTGFGTTATIAYSTATLGSSNVWVRLKGSSAIGTYSNETISIAGGSATSSITASGTVTCPVPTVTFSAAPTTACTSTSVVYTTQASQTNYVWSFSGTLNTDYTIVSGGTTSSNTVTITWLTSGSKTVSVNYTNSSGCSAASATVANTTVSTTVTPAVTIGALPGLSICSGTSVQFSATPSNVGTGYTYQWYLNNVATVTTATYTSTAFADQDQIKVTITTTDGGCYSSASVTSTSSTINVTGSITPTISISPVTSATTCINTNLAFTSSTTNAGTSLPDWYVGGVLAQTSSATFTLNKSVAASYGVVAKISSNAGGCVLSAEQSSTTTTVTVTAPTTIPTISISPATTSICSGNSINFTSTIANGGTQNANWYVDNALVSTNTASYTLTTPTVGSHTVYATLNSDAGGCVSSATQTSSTTTVTVNANVAPIVSIAASATSICTGTAVTFTASPTNGGTSPVYAWYKNTVLVSGQTSATYSYNPANGDAVYAVLTPSSEICVSPATGTSNTVNISVATTLPTASSIYATSAVIYSGQSIKVGSKVTSPSANPTYQWYNGGTAISGATDSIYTTTSLATGSNVLTFKVTDANGCAATTASQTISVLTPTAFTAGNIVVERVGEQAIDYSSYSGKVFLDQYSTGGSLVSSVTMPYSIGCYPSASNFSLTTSGNATSEGFITLSSDGKYISVPGYNIPLGIAGVATTATATSTNNPATINYRSIGLVGADGKATVPLASDILSLNNIRSVASDGTQFWTNGASGFYYFTNSSDNSAKQYAGTNLRSLSIFNGTLYVTSASSPYIGLNTLGTIASLNDNGTASQQLVGAGGTNSTSPYGFVFSPTGDAVYLADDSKGLLKFTSTDGVNYSFAYALTTTTVRGVIGDFSGTYPIFYATTATNARGNTIISIQDKGTAALSSPTQATIATAPFTTTSANSAGNVAAGTLNTGGSVFKGISWAPAATQNGYTYVNTSFRGTAFNSAFGTASIGVAVTNSSNSFGLAGKFISSNVTVTPPVGYEISTSATFSTYYTNSSPLTISSASLSETSANSIYQIYVRFRPTASGAQNGNIAITYGANTRNVAVTGTGLTPTTYYYVSGSLTSASSYTDNGLSTGTKATDISQTNTTWYIQAGNSGIISSAWTLGANSTISVGGGSNSYSLTVSASKLTFGSGAGISIASNGTLNWYDVTAPSLTSISTGSTVNYAGTTISQTIATATYSNLTFSGSGTRVFNSATYTIDNNFTVGAGITVTPSSSTIYFNGTSQNVPGITYNNLTISSSSTATAVGNITTNGTLVIEQGTFTIPSSYSYTQLGTVVTIGTGTAANACILNVNGTFNNGTTTGTTCASFTLNTGGSVVFGASTSVYNHKGNGGSIPKATWNAASNCTVTGITSTVVPSSSFSQTFGNFTWNCASQGSTLNITVNTSSFATSGAFNVVSTNTSYFALDAAISTNYTNSFGSINVSGGTLYTCFRSSSFAPTSTVTVSGNITVSGTGVLNLAGGTSSATYSSPNIATNLSVGGDITVASTATFTASNTDATNGKYNHGKITFTKSGTQTYTNATSGPRFDFALNSGSTVKLGNSVTQTYTSSTDYDALTLNSGSILDINGFTLTANNISGTGKLKGSSTSSLALKGSVANTLYFDATTDGTSNSLKNITITNTNTTTLGNSLNVIGVLTPSNGILASGTTSITDAQGVTRQGYLTLKSTSITSSAIVGVVGGSITGKVTVERFIPKGYRGYRDLSAGAANAGSMFDNWQEGGVSTSGYGIFISGEVGSSKGFNAITGIDYTKTIDSLNWNAYYSNTNTNSYSTGKLQGTHWFYTLDTKSTTLDPYQPYRVLVRGDRSFNMFDTLHIAGNNGNTNMVNATTIRTTGNLITGSVVYSKTGVSNAIYSSSTTKLNTATTSAVSVVANPYVSAVDLSQVSVTGIDGASSNKLTKFYFIDPTFSSTGTYVTVLNGISTPIQSKATSILQPGQSIIVKRDGTSTDPTITFTEASKVTNTTATAIFGTSSINRMDFTLLRKLSTDSTYSLTDGAVAVFKASNSNIYNSNEDAGKLNNANDNISILHSNANLSIDGRALVTANDTIALKLASLSTKAYQLQVDASSFTTNGLNAYIYDAYLKSTTALSTGVNYVNFTVDNANAATYTNRFGVVFKPTTPLSVKAIYASATLKNEVATINWNTQGEEKVATYTVEKSIDAKNFSKVGEVVIANNSNTANYSAIDKNIANGNTYYRIRATNLDGSIQYSNIAQLKKATIEATYSLYPNPLKGKNLTVQMNNVASGKYVINVVNSLGQVVSEQNITHTESVANHSISLGNLAAGIYTVRIYGSGKSLLNQISLSIQ